MTGSAKYALFERIRVFSGLEHVFIVIGFKKHDVAACDRVQPAFPDTADVGGDGGFEIARKKGVAAGVGRVVRDGKGANVDFSDVKILPCVDDAHIFALNRADLVRHAAPSAFGGIDGQIEFPGKDACGGNVIRVFVGDQNRLEAFGLYADFLKLLYDARARNACINQNSAVPFAHIHSVS